MTPALSIRRARRATARDGHRNATRHAIAGAALCVMFLGCGKKPAVPKSLDPMSRPVTQLADAAGNIKVFPLLFAAGAVPSDKERRRYAECMFIVKDAHALSETDAELHVTVLDLAGTDRGEMVWTVTKEESRWKLKKAPLP